MKNQKLNNDGEKSIHFISLKSNNEGVVGASVNDDNSLDIFEPNHSSARAHTGSLSIERPGPNSIFERLAQYK